MANRKNLFFLLVILFVAAVLSFQKIVCDDHWWHVATGRLILENKEIPTQDVFSFTYYGHPWTNNEWGFSLLAALLWDHLGEFGFYIYRWLLLSGIVFCSLKAIEIRSKKISGKDSLPLSFMLMTLAFLFLTLNHRTNVRPHMIGYFSLAITVFAIQKSPEQIFNRRSLFLFAVFALIWALFHPSWILLPPLLLAVWGDHVISRVGGVGKAWTMFACLCCRYRFQVIVIFVVVVAIVAMNADFFEFYRSHLWEMQTINEWRPYWYWFKPEPFFAITICYYLLFLLNLSGSFSRAPLYSMLLMLQMVLSLFIMRFLPEFIIVSVPFVASGPFSLFVSRYLSHKISGPRVRLFWGTLGVLLWIGLFAQYVSPDRSWGMGVDKTQNPVLVADFMERQGLEGNLFAAITATHSYISFRLWPKIKIFIDGRMTVFPVDFMLQYGDVPVNVLSERYPINYLLHESWQMEKYRSSPYKLIYFNEQWSLFADQETIQKNSLLRAFLLLDPENLIKPGFIDAILKQGQMTMLREELAYYGSIAVDPSERRLYELMKAEIAKYGPVD